MERKIRKGTNEKTYERNRSRPRQTYRDSHDEDAIPAVVYLSTQERQCGRFHSSDTDRRAIQFHYTRCCKACPAQFFPVTSAQLCMSRVCQSLTRVCVSLRREQYTTSWSRVYLLVFKCLSLPSTLSLDTLHVTWRNRVTKSSLIRPYIG